MIPSARRTRAHRRSLVLTVPLLAGALALAGCGSDGASDAKGSASATPSAAGSPSAGGSPSAQPSPSGVAAATGPVTNTKLGVSVTGAFGQKPALTIPQAAAPGALSTEVLAAGNGPVIAKGQTLVVNYLGQTWAAKNGQPNIFDNSYDRKAPSAFSIGIGQVIPGWDKALVGQKTGSRLLLAIPPKDAYGEAKPSASPSPSASAAPGGELQGQTLLFVVDVLGAFDPNAAATGEAVTPPDGFPKVTSQPGKKPQITSTSGVKAGAQPTSALLIKGTGETIDTKKNLVLQIVQADLTSGKVSGETWGQNLEVGPGQSVLEVAKALQGQKVGSRAVAVVPGNGQRPAVALVVDVVAQV